MNERRSIPDRHKKLLDNIAKAVHRRYPLVPREELIASGWLGYAEALNRYDNSCGASFETFAFYRIRGAMLDYIRHSRMVTVSRSSDCRPKFTSIEDFLDDGWELAREGAEDSDALIQRIDQKTRVHRAILRLPQYEQELLLLYFWQGMTTEDIARIQGYSKSWLSCLLVRAKTKLKRLLEKEDAG